MRREREKEGKERKKGREKGRREDEEMRAGTVEKMKERKVEGERENAMRNCSS